MNYKNTNAEKSTVTRDVSDFSDKSGNIYQSLIAISKRSNQISSAMKDELTKKFG